MKRPSSPLTSKKGKVQETRTSTERVAQQRQQNAPAAGAASPNAPDTEVVGELLDDLSLNDVDCEQVVDLVRNSDAIKPFSTNLGASAGTGAGGDSGGAGGPESKLDWEINKVFSEFMLCCIADDLDSEKSRYGNLVLLCDTMAQFLKLDPAADRRDSESSSEPGVESSQWKTSKYDPMAHGGWYEDALRSSKSRQRFIRFFQKGPGPDAYKLNQLFGGAGSETRSFTIPYVMAGRHLSGENIVGQGDYGLTGYESERGKIGNNYPVAQFGPLVKGFRPTCLVIGTATRLQATKPSHALNLVKYWLAHANLTTESDTSEDSFPILYLERLLNYQGSIAQAIKTVALR